ncbi:MAG: ubiquinol-cytochrome c reductase iron-sulfur subunit [Betaproteobacteria bacterium]|nr:ubiquinol-cytochrome c reductase iron-sulfur subunit [Betaproteobacteria bacterium]
MPDADRRKLLAGATGLVGAAGLAAASVPFVASMNPSERARAGGAPVEADFAKLGYARNDIRSIKPEYLVLVSICTHLGCVPTFRPDVAPQDLGSDWPGGYYCPCHGSKFDFAGRVYRNVPAPTNLVVPPHKYVSESRVLIGEDTR